MSSRNLLSPRVPFAALAFLGLCLAACDGYGAGDDIPLAECKEVCPSNAATGAACDDEGFNCSFGISLDGTSCGGASVRCVDGLWEKVGGESACGVGNTTAEVQGCAVFD